MSVLPAALERLIAELKRLPGIGPKSARRIAFHLLAAPPERAASLGAAASSLHERISRCGVCGNFTEDQPCDLCRNPERRASVICVVEDASDIAVVEKARSFDGRYHVLAGSVFDAGGSPEDDPRVTALMKRVRSGTVAEVIVATNPTHAGEAAAAWIAMLLKPEGVRVTRIGIGVPLGSELAHADSTTMAEALQHRSTL